MLSVNGTTDALAWEIDCDELGNRDPAMLNLREYREPTSRLSVG